MDGKNNNSTQIEKSMQIAVENFKQANCKLISFEV